MLALVLLLTAAKCPGGDDAEPDPEKYLSGAVQIGVNVDLPGWSEYDNGVWDGFDISLANWLAAEIGFRAQFIAVTTDERLDRLIEASQPGANDRRGADNTTIIKLVISNFSITDARRKHIDLVGPYFSDKQGFLALADSSIKTMEGLAGGRVCIAQGSTNEVRIPHVNAVGVPERTLKRCIERLRAGHVVAVSSDVSILEAFVQTESGLRMVEGSFGSERYGIGIPNNRPKLCDLLAKKLKQFIDDKWDQTFTDNLPGISRKDRKPNSDSLPCEQPAQAMAGLRDSADPVQSATRGLAARNRGVTRKRRRLFLSRKATSAPW